MKFLVQIALFLFVFVPNVANGQVSVHTDLNKIVEMNVSNVPLGEVLGTLMFEHNVRIGYEESLVDSDHTDFDFATNPLTYSVPNRDSLGLYSKKATGIRRVFRAKQHFITVQNSPKSIADVLNSIVNQMGNYKWELIDGVVNIIPINQRVIVFKDFLDVRIANYRLEKGSTVESIEGSIGKLPEVIQFLESQKMIFFEQRVIPGDLKTPISETFVVENLSVRELLNRISLVKGGGWIIRLQTGKNSGQKFLDLDI